VLLFREKMLLLWLLLRSVRGSLSLVIAGEFWFWEFCWFWI
jgi:hypothetical protein